MADGEFPEASIERLKEMGEWMKVNSEAIYATKASPLEPFTWGRCTEKEDGDNTLLYLSVFDWPVDGKLVVPGLKNEIISAKLLSNNEPLKTAAVDNGIVIDLPGKAPNKVAGVIKVEVKGKVENQNSLMNKKMETKELD